MSDSFFGGFMAYKVFIHSTLCNHVFASNLFYLVESCLILVKSISTQLAALHQRSALMVLDL